MSNLDNNTLTCTEDQISFANIVNFVRCTWRKLTIAACMGAFFGFLYWHFFIGYTAKLVLLNNNNNYALDIVSWRTVQKSLPDLASQIVHEDGLSGAVLGQYKSMSDESWWQKNVVPTYALSKADTKDLASIGKDLDAAATMILSLTIKADGVTQQSSIEAAKTSANFLRTGAAYLQLKLLINSYEAASVSQAADLIKKITSTQIELEYLRNRAQNLEQLRIRFPQNNNALGQVVDLKDAGAKYLPIITQIIAVNDDINNAKESLERMNKRLAQIDVINTFLQEALPAVDKSHNGIALVSELLQMQEALTKQRGLTDDNILEALQDLRAKLLIIQTRFTKGLESNIPPVSKKQGMIKAIGVGLAAAFFLALIVLLGQKVLSIIKSDGMQ